VSVGDAAQIAAALVALGALAAAVWQIRLARKLAERTIAETLRDSREQRAYDHSSRFSSDAFLREVAMTWEFVSIDRADPEAEEKRWQEYREKRREDKIALLGPLNFFEELGGLYKHHLLEPLVVKTIFGYTAAELWQASAWFVRRLRETNCDYFAEWEAMVAELSTIPDER
jgi:hypothetical protein